MPRPTDWRRRIGGDGQICGQTFSDSVPASADDVRSREDGNFSKITHFQIAGNQSGLAINSGLRFTNVTVPAGATIEAATIDIICNLNSGNANTVTIINMEAADDPGQVADETDYEARSRTAAGVNWDGQVMTKGNTYTSPDFTAAVQEVVDRGGWASGQAMHVLHDDRGSPSASDWMVYAAWDDTTAGEDPAVLNIQYCA